MNFEIKKYSISDLKEMLESHFWKEFTSIPITKHRAISHIHNPNAQPDDAALLIGFDNSRIVGFQGMMPDYFSINGQPQKIGWLSSWWVHPDYRESMLGGMLLLKAHNSYHGKIAVSAFSEAAGRVFYGSRKFRELPDLSGYRFQLRYPSTRVSKEDSVGVRYKRHLLNYYLLTKNHYRNVKLKRWEKNNSSAFESINVEFIHQIDSETSEFIEQYGEKDLAGRRIAELNWIKKYPWVLTSPVDDYRSEKYFFSSVDKFFELYYCKVFNNNELIGFLILQQRNNHLSVEYAYYRPERIHEIGLFIGQFALKTHIDFLTILYKDLSETLYGSDLPFKDARKEKRTFLVAKDSINLNGNDVTIHPGDGNNVFT